MLTEFMRVLTYDGSGLTDISIENAGAEGVAFAAQESIYIAQKFPFNNLFFQLGLATVTPVDVDLEFWNGDDWQSVVDVIDFTKGFTRDGVIQFTLPHNESWQKIGITSQNEPDSDCPAEIVGLNINHCYWLRMNLTTPVSFTLDKITYGFTTSAKVNGIEKNGSRLYETFETGKTDWNAEIIEASEMMVSEMKSAGILKSAGQIILLDDYVLPCAYRTLMHIYENMGKGYEDKKNACALAYAKFLSGPKTIDADINGKIDNDEIVASTPRLFR